MKLMINGTWKGDIDYPLELTAKRMVHDGCFRRKIKEDSAPAFPAEPGRYHL